MPLVHFPLALLAVGCLFGTERPLPRLAPDYIAASIVNAADSQSGHLAPYAIGTIYGANLAYSTAAISQNDIHGGVLPIMLGASETTVFINNSPAALFYVSPTQINFLVPPNLLPGPVSIYVVVDSWHGPIIQLTLAPSAPALFQMDLHTAVASHADGSVLTSSSPAKPGEIIVLWANGLGQTAPPPENFQLPTAAAPLKAGADLCVLLDGVAVDSKAIAYAGQAPDFAGLYQINLALPMATGADPEIRLQLGGAISIPQIHLPVKVN